MESNPNNPLKEIRFSVVMYGGISLAIYINGVTQELFRMVRATSDDAHNLELDPVEKIYQKLRTDHNTKVVVDILSGTSAGGINAVYLSKALVDNHKDLSLIERVWEEYADIAKLIDDPISQGEYPELSQFMKPTSLLNNQIFYYRLLNALHEMDKQKPEQPTTKLVEELDLYITATNLAGDPIRKQIENSVFDELQFKSVFHFQLKDARDANHDFCPEDNPFLAFAARCTAAIPPAFQPMNLKDIEDVINLPRFNGAYAWCNDATKGRMLDKWNQQTRPSNLEQAYFGDGGYLDNKPFSYAMQDIYRPERGRSVDRKLLYVEPHPEHLKTPSSSRPDLIDNVLKATVILPRYETIQEDIERIEARNRVAEIINSIAETQVSGSDGRQPGLDGILLGSTKPKSGFVNAFRFEPGRSKFAKMNLRTLTKKRGISYYPYIIIRAQSVIDDISNVVARICRVKNGSVEAKKIQENVKGFIVQKHLSERDGQTYSKFLVEYDYQWHLRRLQFLIHKLEEVSRTGEYKPIRVAAGKLYTKVISKLPRSISRKSRKYQLLCGTEAGRFDWKDDFQEELINDIDSFKANYERVYRDYRSFIEGESIPEDSELRASIFRTFTKENYPESDETMQELMRFLSGISKPLFEEVELEKLFEPLTADAAGAENLFIRFFHGYFEALDMLTFPIYYSNRVDVRRIDQPDPIEVIRVSPEDARNVKSVADASEKLAGTRIAHFGGFFKREWRENDILWGRLDAAEILINTVAHDKLTPQEAKNAVDAAQAEILRAYYERKNSLKTVLTAAREAAKTNDGQTSVQSRFAQVREAASQAVQAFQKALGAQSPMPVDAQPIASASAEDWMPGDHRALIDYHANHSLVDPHILTEDKLSLVGRSLQTVGGIIETLAEGRRIESIWPKRISRFVWFLGTLVQTDARQFSVSMAIFFALFVEMLLLNIGLLTGWNVLKSLSFFAFFFTLVVALLMQLLGKLRSGQPMALKNSARNLSVAARIVVTMFFAPVVWLVIINISEADDLSRKFQEQWIMPGIGLVTSNQQLSSFASGLWPVAGYVAIALAVILAFFSRMFRDNLIAPAGVRDLSTANSATRVLGILDRWTDVKVQNQLAKDRQGGT